MKSLLLACLALSGLSLSAQAHEIWIERDAGRGPVRVYFGEPAAAAGAEEEDELGRLQHFQLTGTTGKAGKAVRQGDHLVAPLQAEGDAWLFDDQVFEPWQGEDKRYEAVTYYARAGRSSTSPRLGLELVPERANGDTLKVVFRDKPVAGAEVSVFDPARKETKLTADATGRVSLPRLADGRHLVVVSHKEPVDRQIAGKRVETMYHIATLTFAAE